MQTKKLSLISTTFRRQFWCCMCNNILHYTDACITFPYTCTFITFATDMYKQWNNNKTIVGCKRRKNASGKSELYIVTHWKLYEKIFWGKDKTTFGLIIFLHCHQITTQIPYFMKVICSIKTLCKVKSHKSKMKFPLISM